ncbi:Glycosyltransferase involved in cell wall bisynthesis [Halpernia humi]|uniref:Glycosyltransferase involved in cell wall bisynthesis n=1 Tax=Halpernia humi TaxID=493375 RepID=A0A1H5XWA7_9FLAO|nr:glycosyltransferase [Halpernia humi]SEG15727.1 Glycosyltransferase involved in cell wall bisynthesis [Halpernia humi]
MHVLVSVFNNLYTDQRVEKVCRTLLNDGFEIELIGNNWTGLPEMTRPYQFSRLSLNSKKLRFAYLEFQWKLYKELLKKSTSKTILLANDLDTLWPNYLVSKKLKIPLVYDSHEIFTEMPSLNGRFTKKIWKFLERKLMPKIIYMMTASQSYAEWFQKEYQIKPFVVRNFPMKIGADIPFPENNPKIILYQGVINPSRGLQHVIAAMEFIDNAVFKIIGDGPKRMELENLVKEKKLQNKVQFLGKMLPDEMRKITKTADVGLSVEENGGLSYFYSLPNKISDYIQSKVPLLMSNFPEMMRIKNEFNVGEIIENHNPKHIAEQLKIVLQKGRSYYEVELERASKTLCWENEAPKILLLFNKVKTENFPT